VARRLDGPEDELGGGLVLRHEGDVRGRHLHADRDNTRWPRKKASNDATIVYWHLD
jgi:hypothetical protein